MGNDLQTERESLDDSREVEIGACADSDERPSAATQVPFSSSVDPPRPLQREIEDLGSTAQAPDMRISKPSDESKESGDQPNDQLGQSSQSQLDTQDVSMTEVDKTRDTRECRNFLAQRTSGLGIFLRLLNMCWDRNQDDHDGNSRVDL
jgi:hypothetical protein